MSDSTMFNDTEIENKQALPESIESQNLQNPQLKDSESKVFHYLEILRKIRRLEIINYIIIGLLILILAFSTLSYFKTPPENTADSIKVLKAVDKVTANKIINEIKEHYNNKDMEKLYNLMGEYARTLVSYKDFGSALSQLEILGKMESASYTHYEYLQTQDGGDWFVLNYIARYEAGNGKATVTIKVDGDEWEVLGFRFNVENLNSN